MQSIVLFGGELSR